MTVNVRLAPEQIGYTLAHCGARLLLVHDDFAPLAAALAAKLPALRGTVRLSDDPAAGDDHEAMLASADAGFTFPDFDEDPRATVFYTTGTTGLPQGVSFSHRQLVLHALAEPAFSGSAWPGRSLHRGDVSTPMTPMFHVHAWGVPDARSGERPVALVVARPGAVVDEASVRTQIAELSITGAWTAPAWQQLFEHAMAPLADLPMRGVVAASHIVADLTLGRCEPVHGYLAGGGA